MKNTTDNYSPTQIFEALAYYFGWQGGTVHQLEHETGCNNILYRGLDDKDPNNGFSAIRTCRIEYRINKLTPMFKGDWSYWSGVIRGYWATGALGGLEFSNRFKK